MPGCHRTGEGEVGRDVTHLTDRAAGDQIRDAEDGRVGPHPHGLHEEDAVVTRYLDVAAVIFQLRAVPWQAPGFDARKHRDQLRGIHDQITETGAFDVCSRRFFVQARAST